VTPTESVLVGHGPGGQSINKTNNNVQLIHRPTGIRVVCQQTRSLELNRMYARRILLEKVEFAPTMDACAADVWFSLTSSRILVYRKVICNVRSNSNASAGGGKKPRTTSETRRIAVGGRRFASTRRECNGRMKTMRMTDFAELL
jgi:hypothetical protein